jgi:hypothetical protein
MRLAAEGIAEMEGSTAEDGREATPARAAVVLEEKPERVRGSLETGRRLADALAGPRRACRGRRAHV